MTAEDMLLCIREDVHVVLDSLGQVKRFCNHCDEPCEIGIRLNVGSVTEDGEFHSTRYYRFGLTTDEVDQAITCARTCGVTISGAHSYFGTDIMSPQLLLEGLRRLCAAAERLPDLKYVDVAGGFGVSDQLDGEEFDIVGYGRSASGILQSQLRRRKRPIELYVEPGRYLAAGCGWFFVKVVDTKIRSDRVFVGTNASIAGFPRPLMYPDKGKHPCELLGAGSKTETELRPVFLCGNSTYSRDFLARALTFPLPEVGDTVVFHNAGAYCRSMISDFLGKERPAEVVLAHDRSPQLSLSSIT